VRKTRFDETSWEGVDRGLFERLRTLRREIADERQIPAYIVFSDATLRDMARIRPASPASLLRVRGIGERKVEDLGPKVLSLIGEWCSANALAMDVLGDAPTPVSRRPDAAASSKPSRLKEMAFVMFSRNATVEQVALAVERAPSTVVGYLAEFLAAHPSHSSDAWIKPETVEAVMQAASEVGARYLKPIFEHLGGAVPYDQIRIALARHGVRPADSA
jgi:ATP-dependent DNA helicase RecQ